MAGPVRVQLDTRSVCAKALRELKEARDRATAERALRGFSPPIEDVARKYGLNPKTLLEWYRRGVQGVADPFARPCRILVGGCPACGLESVVRGPSFEEIVALMRECR